MTKSSDPATFKRNRRSIFVTVGTTKFDSLISAISDPQFLRLISQPKCGGYGSLTVQYGRGEVMPFATSDGADQDNNSKQIVEGISCSSYRFKPTLRKDMEGADLILSHAGAGSIMEGLEQCRSAAATANTTSKKRLVVVTNAALMNAHQSELADALEARGHLFVINDPKELLDDETLQRIDAFDPIPFEGGDGGVDFAALVDNHFGFDP